MAEPWRVHTIVFDLDDTLIAERDYVLSGFAAVDAWIRLNLSRSGFETMATKLFTDGKRGKIFNEAVNLLGLPASADLVPRLIDVYRSHEPQISLLPDAKEVLEWARSKFNLGIISDGWLSSQERKVRV
jgi:putative hydrolase of the HAD superfamily